MPAIPSSPRLSPTGQVLWNTNQRLSSDEMNAMGEHVWRALGKLADALVWAGSPGSYPMGGVFGSTDLEVTIDSGLTLEVAAGLGFYAPGEYDTSDYDEPTWDFLGLETADTVTLDAHDAQPRIDVISIGPSSSDGVSDTRQIWDAGTESFGPDTVNTRRFFFGAVTVTKGTPAGSPAAPATPANHLKLAEVAVPATSGAVTITDFREFAKIRSALLEVGPNELVDPPVCPLIAIGAEVAEGGGTGDRRQLTITTMHWDWSDTVEITQRYMLECFDATGLPETLARWVVTTGTILTTEATSGNAVAESNATGVLVVKLYPAYSTPFTGSVWVRITPVGYGAGGPPRPGFSQMIELTFGA